MSSRGASLAAIVEWCDATLEADAFADYGPNGLQVVGAEDVRHIASAVSVSLDVIERAAAADAQLLLVHHGLFWRGADPRIGVLERRRLRALFEHDIALVAYHLPLDAHPVLGNNAVLADLVGLTERAPFGEHGGRPIGCSGVLPAARDVDELAALLGEAINARPLVFRGGSHPSRRVGIVSGGAARDIRAAHAAGLDTHITGEPTEDAPYLAAELGVHLIAAGHYATETVGVQALAAAIADAFPVTTSFLAVDNPV
jgi:dinuclear metal center YbgI/SA1388 family protein